MTNNNKSILDDIRIASPCTAEWNAMTGDEQVRFCGQCKKNVYNLSNMSRSEAEELIRVTEGKLCVRFYQRKDGTMLTEDCPVGLRALRNTYRWAAAVVAAGISCLFSFLPAQAEDKSNPDHPKEMMGEPTMIILTPTSCEKNPWLINYRKNAEQLVISKLPKNYKAQKQVVRIQVHNNGTLLSCTPISYPNSTDMTVRNAVVNTQFQSFEPKMNNIVIDLTIEKK